MDLAAARKSLAEREAVRERIAAELARVNGELERASQLAHDAQAHSKAKAVAAVIEATDAARGEAARAKEALAVAFEAETDLRDQLPILDNALGEIEPVIAALRAAIGEEEKARLLAAFAAIRPGALDQLHEAAAQLLVLHFNGEPIHGGSLELGFVLERQIDRARLLDRAEQLRHELRDRALAGEVAP